MREMMLGGSVLLLALAALRRALRRRLDPRFQYALWLIVAARLLIPGTLFASPVALPVTDPAAVAGEAMDSVLNWGTDIPLMGYPGSQRTWIPSWVPEEELSGKVHGDTRGNTTYILTTSWTGFFRFWAPIVWICGAAGMALWLVLINWRFYTRLYTRRRRLNLPAGVGAGKLRVYGVEGLDSPYLFGLLRPAVYIDDRGLSPERLRHILTHEYTHYRHGNHLWALVRGACLTVHWFNPLVWWAAAMSRRDCELACDAGALNRLGEDQRLDYGQTLLAVAAGQSRLGHLLRTSTAMNESKKTMKERIGMIVKRPKTLSIAFALALVTAAAAVAVTFGGKAEAAQIGRDLPEEVLAGVLERMEPADGDQILRVMAGGGSGAEWLPLLRDLDWSTAFSGADRETDWTLLLLEELYCYVKAPETGLSDEDYLVIFSADGGLDGAYAEAYQGVVWTLYLRDPQRFVALLQERMDAAARADVLWWIKGELVMEGYAGSTGEISDERALELLTDPLTAVYVESPLYFTAPGQTARIQLKNVSGDYTASYDADDAAVVAVDETGLVTAVGPGIAYIRIYFQGADGERALYCYADFTSAEEERP